MASHVHKVSADSDLTSILSLGSDHTEASNHPPGPTDPSRVVQVSLQCEPIMGSCQFPAAVKASRSV